MHICAELFTQTLRAKNLTFNTYEQGDNTVVDFPYQGKVVKCFFNGTGTNYVSLYLVYERVPEEKYADAIFVCNELNAKFKWATFYVDNDKDIVIHDDAILAVENAAEETLELLVRLIKIGDDVKPIIMRTLYA